MHELLVSFAKWLEGTPWGVGVRTSLWAYPFTQLIHFTGLSIWLGTNLALDLRLLGVGKQKETAAQLAGLVSLMRGESADDHLGGRAMLNALSTAMFALVLRLASETEDTPRGILALAGHPRLAPAVAALFNEPERAWSLPDLARLCNMSRATLARQFQEKLGRSASDLLTDIRMTLAANQLKKSSLSTGAVAEAVGYQSEAAFQRAFKGYMGITPAQWRKLQEPAGQGVFARLAVPGGANPTKAEGGA